MGLWTCPHCGCRAIARDLGSCPQCHEPREETVPKATVYTGASNEWEAAAGRAR